MRGHVSESRVEVYSILYWLYWKGLSVIRCPQLHASPSITSLSLSLHCRLESHRRSYRCVNALCDGSNSSHIALGIGRNHHTHGEVGDAQLPSCPPHHFLLMPLNGVSYPLLVADSILQLSLGFLPRQLLHQSSAVLHRQIGACAGERRHQMGGVPNEGDVRLTGPLSL